MEDYPNYNLNVNAINISWYLESSLIKLGLMVVENPQNPQILHIIIIVWKKARECPWQNKFHLGIDIVIVYVFVFVFVY